MSRVRFAPSPTGLLHVGNARVALANALHATRAGARFLLRIDDTDTARSRPEYAEAIVEDLAWLGILPDETVRQSDRLDRYAAAAGRLKASGRLYPCYETPEELDLQRAAQRAAGRPPRYDRSALRLDAAARADLEAQGRVPHWRFRLEDRPVEWTDIVRGPVRFDGPELSDPVLLRADGEPLYTFASVVDDLELAADTIIRGEDHVANTAVQIQIFAALGGDPARLSFAHLPLLVDAEGKGLSKRLGSLSLRSLREEGFEPLGLAAYLATLGTGRAPPAVTSLAELAADFDLGAFGRAPARFDPAELARASTAALRAQPWEAVRERVPAEVTPELWEAVRGNVDAIGDVARWAEVVAGRGPAAEGLAPAFLAQAADLLPPEPWDAGTWKAWTGAVSAATGAKGKALFLPLRRALTGYDHGPELAALLPLIGRIRAQARLRDANAAPV